MVVSMAMTVAIKVVMTVRRYCILKSWMLMTPMLKKRQSGVKLEVGIIGYL